MSETTDTVSMLHDILAGDARIIVASDMDLGYIITWDRMLPHMTLQCWNNHLDEVDMRVLSYTSDYYEARECALMWFDDMRKAH
jgi:hypothetical protein